jgi:hypothetical protein
MFRIFSKFKLFDNYRCEAVVTTPLNWAYTECFVLGDHTMISGTPGWRTAERTCFDIAGKG